MVERTNKELGQFLRTLLKGKHTEWANWLGFIEQCLNYTFHDTIETTPLEAHFGKKPERIWTKLVPHPETQQRPDFEKYKLIAKKIRDKGEKRANKVNQGRKHRKYNLGDQVLVVADNKSNALEAMVGKLMSIYEGPYRITKIIFEVTYELAYLTSKKIRGVFHTNLLRPYFQHGNTTNNCTVKGTEEATADPKEKGRSN